MERAASSPIPVHSGALKYYLEKGIKFPETTYFRLSSRNRATTPAGPKWGVNDASCSLSANTVRLHRLVYRLAFHEISVSLDV